jgi:hypothetical protein
MNHECPAIGNYVTFYPIKCLYYIFILYMTMTQKKATATLAVIVVIASLMVGATIAIALISEGVGIQKASAQRRLHLCPPQTPNADASPPCGRSTIP